MAADDCPYCRDWNAAHPGEAAKTACGPCDFCGEPGHIGGHPRQPVSICLCEKHWREISTGFHFETYHLVGAIVLAIAGYQIVSLILGWWSP